jgi:hypothetical protein
LKDFVGYLNTNPVRETNPLRSTELIIERWTARLNKEKSFILKSQTLAPDITWWDGRHTGVIPYSSKRFAIRQWPSLYLEVIAPRITDQSYERKVHSWLAAKSSSNPPVHYVGLFTVPPAGIPKLSLAGEQSYQSLRDEVGDEHIHWRAVGIHPVKPDTYEFFGWKPALDNG